MAAVVLQKYVDNAGLSGRVVVASCGTGGWHVGQPMDRRAAATLIVGDYDPSAHRARQFEPTWLEDNDLVLAMDRQNLADVLTQAPDAATRADGAERRVRLYRDFDPVEAGGDVPDPYLRWGRRFEEVLVMVERTSATLVAALQRDPGLAVEGTAT